MNHGRSRRQALRTALVLVAIASPLWAGATAGGVVPPPQFNCVGSQPAAFTNPTDVAIPDATAGALPGDPDVPGAAVTSTIVVSGLSGTIYDVDLTTKIPHSAPGDLVITLTSPSGKTIAISDGNGGVANNALNGTTWDDDADPDGLSTEAANNGLVTDHGFQANVLASPLVPQEALAIFKSDDPNGTWTVTVQDFLPEDLGTIEEWSLAIATQGSAVGQTPPVFEFGDGLTVANGQTSTATLSVRPVDATISSISLRTQFLVYDGFGDLTLTLTSPSGTTITLTSGNGGAADVNNPQGALPAFTEWRLPPPGPSIDLGPTPISLVDFASSLPFGVAPEESLGALVGENPSGTWVLTASDAGLIPGGGTIHSFILETTGVACASDAQLVVSGPAQPVRIGDPVTYEALVSSTGPGLLSAPSVTFRVPDVFRRLAIEPSLGGTCGPVTPSGQVLTCTWPGGTVPGSPRRVLLTGEYYLTPALTSFRVEMRATGYRAAAFGSGPAPVLLSAETPRVPVLPSNRRAFDGSRCNAIGTNGPDDLQAMRLRGTRLVLCGLGGNDKIVGTGLNDVLDGGTGKDEIRAGAGNDRVDGGPGDDVIRGELGTDILRGGPGRDRLNGGFGRDVLIGGSGLDFGFAQQDERALGVETIRLVK